MTTLETLTLDQVNALSTNAAQAGDLEMVADCTLVSDAYIASDESELSAAIDAERGEVRSAAQRIVDCIRDTEAQSDEPIAYGYTFADWLSAAGRQDTASEYDLRAAWRAGENPAEYATEAQ
jgi:hypothetical protein